MTTPVWETAPDLPSNPYDQVTFYIRIIATNTISLSQLNEQSKDTRKYTQKVRLEARRLRDASNAAGKACRALLRDTDKLSDRGKREKLNRLYIETWDRHSCAAQVSVKIERAYRDQIEASKSKNMEASLAANALALEEEEIHHHQQQQQQLYLGDKKSSLKDEFDLEEIDASDAAIIDELNRDISECKEDLEVLVDVLGKMDVEIRQQGGALKDMDEEFDVIDQQLIEGTETLEEIPCYCCRSCCQCCSCWNKVLCTIS